MSSQPAVRFHEPPVTECNSMEVDDSSESRMSLDQLDAIYLGPDDELDSDSGSSSGRDVLNAIPDQSHPALTDDLPLFNDPDLYLGPEDDVIEFDDAPAVPDSPMTVSDSTPEPHSASPAVPEAPMTSNSTAIERQSPKPEMAYEDLHAMVREFMPIGSFDHTEHRLGDYEQRHGNLPDPTVAQLLESHRPFRNTWAETCDKLRKADADLRRMQRVRQSTVEMLEVLETLIDYFEDEDPGRDSGLGIRDSGLGLCFRTPNPELRSSGLGTGTRASGTQYSAQYQTLSYQPRTPKFGARDYSARDPGLGTSNSELGTRDLTFGTRDSGLGTRDSGLGTRTRDSGLGTRDSGLGTRDSGLGTRDSGLGTRDSGLGTRDSDSGLGLGTRDLTFGTWNSIPDFGYSILGTQNLELAIQ
ncbi:hypothetical protein EV702DRAFT_1266684 [Suillus placidus]|uniref:Uncharacterized protein n=1 Tax=Suillus placidus TaxID=48579 RepID=A0A9P7A0Y2_9AGAM|nr:hypothetical protein EV702DRAFT_1266684 [Suillus placidus]